MQKQQEEEILSLLYGMSANDRADVLEVCTAFSRIDKEDRDIVKKILRGLVDDLKAKPIHLKLVASNSAPSNSVFLR